MPVVLSLVDEYPEILIQLLVYPFSLSIRLWMPSRQSCELDSEKSVELLRECGDELGSTVRYDIVGETMVLPDIVEEEPDGSFSGYCRGGWYKVDSF